MNTDILFKMLGINAEEMKKQAHDVMALVKTIDDRLTRIEEKLSIVVEIVDDAKKRNSTITQFIARNGFDARENAKEETHYGNG